MSTPQIYVASLADYNAGRLVGAWIDANQSADAIQAEVDEMLLNSEEEMAEEWAIHDTDNFYGIDISEYESFERISDIGMAIDEHGEAVGLLLSYDPDMVGSLDDFDYIYKGKYDSEEEFICDYYEEWEAHMPSNVWYAIDWTEVWQSEDQLISVKDSNYKFHIFDVSY